MLSHFIEKLYVTLWQLTPDPGLTLTWWQLEPDTGLTLTREQLTLVHRMLLFLLPSPTIYASVYAVNSMTNQHKLPVKCFYMQYNIIPIYH